jgi:hypothetical protein
LRTATSLVLALAALAMTATAPPAGARGGDAEEARGLVISARPVALRGSSARVRLSCRAPRGCDGTLVLRVRGRTIGKREFDLSARRRNARVSVRLTRAGLRMVRATRRTRVTAVASVRLGDGRRVKPSERFWLHRSSVS